MAKHHSHDQEPLSWQKRLRVLAALLMLIALTAAFVDFRELVPVTLGHWLASLQFVPALLAMASGALVPTLLFAGLVLITLLFGRIYCSVLCPLGLLQDGISRIARLFKRKRKSLPFAKEQVWLRHSFVWATVLASLLGWGAFALTVLDPYSHFGRIASALFRPLLTWVNNHVVWLAEAAGVNSLYRVDLPLPGLGALIFPALVLTLLVFMAALRGRLWCNTVCPVGTILGWMSKHAAFRIGINTTACTKCAQCIRACKAQCIDLRAGQVDFSRCVACYDCVSVCDEQGIGYKWSWGRKVPAVSGAKNPERRAILKNSVQGLLLGSSLAVLARNARAEESGYGGAKGEDAASGLEGKETHSSKHDISGKPLRAESLGVAPPGAKNVPRFLDRCTACQLCVSACPKHVLQPALFEYGLKGFMKPRLDFTASFCDYDCRVCAEACPDKAIELMPIEDKQLEQIGIAAFYEERCIVKVKGTDCAACSEHCPTKAVSTISFGDNLRIPQVNESLCIGCGACQFACPVLPEKAILVKGLREHGRAVRAAKADQPNAPKAPAGDFPF